MDASDESTSRCSNDLDVNGGRSAARRSPRRRSSERISPLEGLADFVTRRVETIGESLKTLAAVRTDRAQLALRRRKQSLIVTVVMGVVGGTALIYAVILLVGGLADGMRSWSADAPWLGDVLTALLVLGLTALALALLFRAENRRGLEESRAKYARTPGGGSDTDAV